MLFVLALAVLIGGCGAKPTIGGPVAHAASPPPIALDRSEYSDVGTAERLDYGEPEMWACRPDLLSDECHADMTATELLPDGTRRHASHERASAPPIDCFYVYPTVLLTGAPQMVDFSDAGVAMVNDALLAQAARFSQHCRVFAPLYRQIGLSGGKPAPGANPALASQDVRDAFAHYLQRWNHGRGFVLVGHSQGTGMLTSLIQQDIDPPQQSAVRARMLSALLIGGRISVPRGEVVGGTFQNVPLCEEPGQRGCVIAYVSYAADAPPAPAARFGTSSDGMQAACVNPARMAGNAGAFAASYFRKGIGNASFVPDDPLPDDLATPFALYRERFSGRCVERGSHHYLEVAMLPGADAAMPAPPWRHAALEEKGFGLHLVDFQIPLGDLLAVVARHAAEAP